jgi:hypothetical protein
MFNILYFGACAVGHIVVVLVDKADEENSFLKGVLASITTPPPE